MRRGIFAVAASAALLIAAIPAFASEGGVATTATHRVGCSVPGTWPRTRDASWLRSRLKSVGYRDIGCTGSAFVVVYGEGRGHDLYIWAITAPRLVPESSRFRVVVGVRVYGDAIRLAWRAGRRSVWLEQGPTTRRLPPRRILERLVAATTSP